MASVNKVILLGNLGADPEVRYMTNGDAVANIRLATTESWKDKNTGEKKEITEWHRVVFYNRLAEIAGEYLRKGRSVYIEGRLEYGSYDKDGVKHYTTDIIGDEMQMLGGGSEGGGGGGSYDRGPRPQRQESAPRPQSSGRPAPPPADDFSDDDIPF